jgi:hypothetical protein
MLKRIAEYLSPAKVLFHRDFREYTGGHQKVYDYFCHLQARPGVRPYIHFTPSSRWDETNPWRDLPSKQRVPFAPAAYDWLFLAGMDWQAYLAAGLLPDKPVVNLIQHVRHGDPAADVYPFLTQRAIRICVSAEVADAIQSTGRVNGPVLTIPNGLDIPAVPQPRVRDVYILGAKQPALARALAAQLEQAGYTVLATSGREPRTLVLQHMATSHVTVALPNSTEGFYLPALEAMALSDVAVVPDCVGNRSFCRDRHNCLMPALQLEALAKAVGDALALAREPGQLATLRAAAGQTVSDHALEKERRAFYALLDDLDQLWCPDV